MTHVKKILLLAMITIAGVLIGAASRADVMENYDWYLAKPSKSELSFAHEFLLKRAKFDPKNGGTYAVVCSTSEITPRQSSACYGAVKNSVFEKTEIVKFRCSFNMDTFETTCKESKSDWSWWLNCR